jgi:hypothetical protein
MSNSSLIGVYGGQGAVPVGVIMPWVSGYFTAGTNTGHTPILASADTIAAANSYLNTLGYYVCDGSALNIPDSPVWNVAGRYLPNLTDSRFLMGATTVGAAANGGSNVMTDHKHANTNLSVVSESSHTHAVGTYANTAESSHTHAVGTYANTAELSHTHNWGGNWSNDNSTTVASPEGDGSGNTYSDTGNGVFAGSYWGAGTYKSVTSGDDSPDHTHILNPANVYTWTSVNNNQGYPTGTSGIFPLNYSTGGASTRHAHTYYLPSHRHWIKSRASGAGSSHNHIISGTSAAGSSHTHPITGSSAAGSSHTHTLSGVIGSGTTDPVAGTIENRPQYMNCFMIIRVK